MLDLKLWRFIVMSILLLSKPVCQASYVAGKYTGALELPDIELTEL